MRLFGKVNSSIDRFDHAGWLSCPFDLDISVEQTPPGEVFTAQPRGIVFAAPKRGVVFSAIPRGIVFNTKDR